jgi:hypothetical protein
LCLSCHQGRSSIATVNGVIAGKDLDVVASDLDAIDIHFFAAGATLFGTEVQGAYEYDGPGYNGRFAHVDAYQNCAQCHDPHRQEVEAEACGTCHAGVGSAEDLGKIRMADTDWDGDADTTEGIAGEISTMRDLLYETLQGYALEVAGTPLVFSEIRPHFFADLDGDGSAGASELDEANRYQSWTPRLLRAAYNYQHSMSDPGAFAHNGQYILQLLYDSIADMDGDVSGLTRPPVRP